MLEECGIPHKTLPPFNRSTGQDAVAVIKSEMQLLLPSIRVFLDVRRQGMVHRRPAVLSEGLPVPAQVDDLDDIGALESYIGRSQVILIFLSRGYFKSKVLVHDVAAVWPTALALTGRPLRAELPAGGSRGAVPRQANHPRPRSRSGQGRRLARGAAIGMPRGPPASYLRRRLASRRVDADRGLPACLPQEDRRGG